MVGLGCGLGVILQQRIPDLTNTSCAPGSFETVDRPQYQLPGGSGAVYFGYTPVLRRHTRDVVSGPEQNRDTTLSVGSFDVICVSTTACNTSHEKLSQRGNCWNVVQPEGQI